jgi:hypothetical protein
MAPLLIPLNPQTPHQKRGLRGLRNECSYQALLLLELCCADFSFDFPTGPELLTLTCPSIFQNSSINQSQLHAMMLCYGVPKTAASAVKHLVKLALHFDTPPPASRLKFFWGICFALVASYPRHGYDLDQIPRLERKSFHSLLSWVNLIFRAIQYLKCTQSKIENRPQLGSLASFLASRTIGVMLGPETEKAAPPAAIELLLNLCHLCTWRVRLDISPATSFLQMIEN